MDACSMYLLCKPRVNDWCSRCPPTLRVIGAPNMCPLWLKSMVEMSPFFGSVRN